ncbi:4-oxalocrotonate tautomerase [Candidatus Poribacteria bacterium]|jgi:4-oxalocrotonate tautomerase|nr:4-oxalocrotonate tautomerase [Candidatus Poribacteria bacterium]MBT5536294.1 4-oxalocrotonate tautomerase [Candidatus Poribacteria bacterium]MBT5712904.1 4-oxalocrotonate tautomerase [Candidatus Poribacteria bacterium]MBT7101425.1 4-oxalocrotonate tautomerase [Candidatus Poribacteria bacterium]MBT7808755.1 4-oxalocrotonate tautomerase [Candidatus Poribacteria bacterium]
MPHVNVRMYPGRTEEQKRALTAKIIEAFGEAMDIPSKWLTVAIEEVEPDDWKADVVGPEIRAKEEFLYKEPEYLDD